jgi:hypothetical protein
MVFRKHQYGDTTHTAQPELLTKPVDLPVDIAYISGTCSYLGRYIGRAPGHLGIEVG